MLAKTIESGKTIKLVTPEILYDQIYHGFKFQLHEVITPIERRVYGGVDYTPKKWLLFKLSKNYREEYYRTVQEKKSQLLLDLKGLIEMLEQFEKDNHVKITWLPEFIPLMHFDPDNYWGLPRNDKLLLDLYHQCMDYLETHHFFTHNQSSHKNETNEFELYI